MDIFIKNAAGQPRALDVKRRAWSLPVAGAPAVYRARTWSYKGRRKLVKVYPTFPAAPSGDVVSAASASRGSRSETMLSFPPQKK